MEFNAHDVDFKFLSERALKESEKIYSKESPRDGRNFMTILKTSIYGHVPEVYLIEKHGFSDDLREYRDVIDPNGIPVEIKATEGEYYVPYVLGRASKAKMNRKKDYPNILYIFIGNKKTLDYKLQGIYEWGKTKFVLQRTKTNV